MLPSTCTICDTVLPAFPPVRPPVCPAPKCRWAYQTLPLHQLCKICGRRLSVPDQSAGACVAWGCWTALCEQRRRAREAHAAALIAAFCASAAEKRPLLRDRSLRIIEIPAYAGTSTRLPDRRREILRRRLLWLVQQPEPPASASATEPSPASAPATDLTVQHACTTCRGTCCQHGNEHAYLTPFTIQRVRANHPDWSDERIVDGYLSHVPSRSYAKSCIYHGSTGCGLPRAMRSDTCNNFFCNPMTEFLKLAAVDPAAPVFLASVNSYTIRAGVLFDGERVERVATGRTSPAASSPSPA